MGFCFPCIFEGFWAADIDFFWKPNKLLSSSSSLSRNSQGCRCCFNPTIELLLWWYPSSASIRLQLFPSSSENAHHYEIWLHTFIIIKVIINSIYPIHSTVLQLIRPPTFQSVNLHVYRLVCIRKIHQVFAHNHYQPINSRMRINYADQPGSYFYLLCQCFQDGFIYHVPISVKPSQILFFFFSS